MDYGMMFFSSVPEGGDQAYHLLMETTRFADTHGFSSVWTPERHFHAFGGIFPNPAVVNAGLATITKNVQLRAGSLIAPLHHVVRIAENFSVLDNLSGGRAAISYGSGWNVNDFVFYPERYERRQAVMYEHIETVRRLWAGETIELPNTYGKMVEIAIHPRPIQRDLPIWVTSSGNVETFISAGKVGANLLTHLIGQDIDTLAEKIVVYRDALREHGWGADHGKVSLMLHTFLGPDEDEVKRTVREPFREYLRSAVKLEVEAVKGGGAISGGHKVDDHDVAGDDMEQLLDLTFDRYYETGSLLGTPAKCKKIIMLLEEIGVDEIACLIDFPGDEEKILAALPYLDELRQATSSEALAEESEQALAGFMDDLDEDEM